MRHRPDVKGLSMLACLPCRVDHRCLPDVAIRVASMLSNRGRRIINGHKKALPIPARPWQLLRVRDINADH
jgi:hypothetical protein